MLESKYLCTFGLFASIPTLDESETVTQETLRWNETMQDVVKVAALSRWPSAHGPEVRA